jgi:CheY-like chemotaxis protein
MGRSRTILVADDNRTDVSLLSYALREAGFNYHIRWLKNGETLLRYLRRRETARRMPLLVLMDWNMPQSKPPEILKWIRSQPQYLNLLIAVLTGSSDPGERTRALDAGANWHIVKSADFSDVAQLVDRIQQFWLRPKSSAA